MKALKHILVPTDFSSDSVNALKHAAQIAEMCNAEISLIHAYRLIQPPEKTIGSKNILHFKKDLEKAIQNKFSEISSGLIPGFSRVKFVSQVGFPEDVIESYVSKESPDLIVMGTLGQSRSTKIFGQTLSAVVSNTDFPILAIPPGNTTTNWKSTFLCETPQVRKVDSSQLIEHLMKVSYGDNNLTIPTKTDQYRDETMVFSMTKNEYHLLVEQLQPAEWLQNRIQFFNPILIG